MSLSSFKKIPQHHTEARERIDWRALALRRDALSDNPAHDPWILSTIMNQYAAEPGSFASRPDDVEELRGYLRGASPQTCANTLHLLRLAKEAKPHLDRLADAIEEILAGRFSPTREEESFTHVWLDSRHAPMMMRWWANDRKEKRMTDPWTKVHDGATTLRDIEDEFGDDTDGDRF